MFFSPGKLFLEASKFSSITQSCPTLWPHGLQHTRLPCPSPIPRACSNSCPLSWWCQPSHPLSSPFPPAFNLFQWVSSSHQVAKVLQLQLHHQSFQWIFSTDFLYDWLVWSRCFWTAVFKEELLLLNCGVGEDSWESLGLQGDQTSQFISKFL